MPQPPPLITRSALALAALAFAAYLTVVFAHHAAGRAAAARGEVPLFTDFTTLYAAGLQLRDGGPADLYDRAKMAAAGERAAGAAYAAPLSRAQTRVVGPSPFLYPPPFIPVAAALAQLPYLAALVMWLAIGGVIFVAALHATLRQPGAWVFALAAPPVFFNLMYGQTGFLVAGLLGLGLALLTRRPLLAGVLMGLASVKPHLGLLLPLALVAGGHWRACGAAALTVAALAAATLAAWGAMPWRAFLAALPGRVGDLAAGHYDFSAMVSVAGAVFLAGGDARSAWLAQGGAALVAILAVAWAWHGRSEPDPRRGLAAAVLCAATPLALPSVYLYDLTLLVPAAAWLWLDMDRRGCRAWEPGWVGGSLLAVLALKTLAQSAALPLGPLPAAALLALALLRLHETRRSAATG